MSQHEEVSNYRVLIADDESSLRLVLSATLKRAGYEVAVAKNGLEALALLRQAEKAEEESDFDVLIADLSMPQMDGVTLLDHVLHEYEDLPVVILTAHGTVDIAVQALKNGAFDFLTKPYERDEILTVIKKAIKQRYQNSDRIRSPLRAAPNLKSLIGQSTQMQYMHDVINKVANSPSTVLITGESGTGKELVAKALHMGSCRKDKPFISINCAAIPESLIEAELFGYEKGAFTGAVNSKPGRFELAHEGTLFLDEIGDLPIEMQVKLLRALQESVIERIGGIKSIQLNVRLISATNRNLQQAISEGKFREDLYYRLNVVPIFLPALRERKEDIPDLVEHFIGKYNQRLNREICSFSSEALKILQSYSWPGNIRELENIVERTILFSDKNIIDIEDLPMDMIVQTKKIQISSIKEEASMKEIVKNATLEIERDLIAVALGNTHGNVTHAARQLKISRKCLQLKMKELGFRHENEEQIRI